LKNKFAPIFFFFLTSAGNGQHWSVNSFTSLYWQPSGCQLFPFHQPSPALAFKSCLHWQPTGCQFYSCNQRWPCQRWLYPCFTGTSAGLQSQRWLYIYFTFTRLPVSSPALACKASVGSPLLAAYGLPVSSYIHIYIYIYKNKYFKYTVYFFNVNPVLFTLVF
jgi:hypothetical protein